MNTLIGAAVGAIVAAVVVVVGVNAAQSDQKTVSNERLYSYSDE